MNTQEIVLTADTRIIAYFDDGAVRFMADGNPIDAYTVLRAETLGLIELRHEKEWEDTSSTLGMRNKILRSETFVFRPTEKALTVGTEQ